jgi:hypothetical protein
VWKIVDRLKLIGRSLRGMPSRGQGFVLIVIFRPGRS